MVMDKRFFLIILRLREILGGLEFRKFFVRGHGIERARTALSAPDIPPTHIFKHHFTAEHIINKFHSAAELTESDIRAVSIK